MRKINFWPNWLIKIFNPGTKEPQTESQNQFSPTEDLDDVASFLRDITQKLWEMINPGCGFHPDYYNWRDGEQWAKEFNNLRSGLSEEKRLAFIKQLEDEEKRIFTSGEIVTDVDLGSIIGVRGHLRKKTDK